MANQPNVIPISAATVAGKARSISQKTTSGASKNISTRTTGSQPPPPGGHEVDIAKLQTHVGWLAKGLVGLATVSAVVLGWLIINLYTPMHDLSKDVAVQTAQMTDIKESLGEVKDQLKEISDNAQKGSPKRKN